MASNRIGRINEEIQKELANLIPNLKDPRVQGLISVTGVDTTPDLRYAKVYISVLDKSTGKEVIKGLKSAGGYLRREIGRSLQLRYTPELVFEEDTAMERGARIFDILSTLDIPEDDGNDESAE
ncbi:MAG: 30S ribosome-binding factor RbfA [Ruminococcaceae bacterium]|nr:30S ribosome-binding factor RbfA [Oscillospiraceae bacterium]